MPRAIPSDIANYAQQAAKATGIPASIQLAQWAVESAWGARQPGNNPFGIKAQPGQDHVTFTTHEEIHGVLTKVVAVFRSFPSIGDAFMEHAKLLAKSPKYAGARMLLPDVVAFCFALTGVYATDSHYGATLRDVIRSNRLTLYDHPATQ